MKKVLFLLLTLPLFFACSSDDKEETIPEGEKIAVTESDILGFWEYIESDKRRYTLSFSNDDVDSHYTTYLNDKIIRDRYFKFSIDGFTLYLKGGSLATDIPLSETEIFKRGDKLYFNNMPFTSLKTE